MSQCSQSCTNTVGSFMCTCNSGYSLSNDGITCIDINECSIDAHGCQQICINTDGAFRCECNSGYQLNFDQLTCSGKLQFKCNLCLVLITQPLSLQILMNALVTLMAVVRSVLTQKDHLSAVVGVASLCWMMERLVWRSMSVHWAHMIASSSV